MSDDEFIKVRVSHDPEWQALIDAGHFAKERRARKAPTCSYCHDPGHRRWNCDKALADGAFSWVRRKPKAKVNGGTRAVTESEVTMRRRLRIVDNDNSGDDLPARPRTRGDCEGVPRPCPFISCRYSLYLDVSPLTGAIKLNFPTLDPDQMRESCALDIADRDGVTLEEIGAAMGLTRERVRQIETMGLEHAAKAAERLDLSTPIERLASPLAGAQTL